MATSISDLDNLQSIIQSASTIKSNITAYIEPDDMKFSIIFRKDGEDPSPYLSPVTFTWNELFMTIP